MHDTILTGLIPAETRKSTITLFILVWPILKSSPATNTFFCQAISMKPGTKVFSGAPLMYVLPSKMDATVKTVEALISASLISMLARMFSAVSFLPSLTAVKRSVLAVQRAVA